ncbi:hypothetical protein POM88_013067 [Heracleum sosnowskyi]|uniref:Choline/ethanolamine kinase n=1 Tax=Heracleum sosnowskyi TaxID=360622 RepID=A0AAD8IYI8_9APIA|nr:hypothetical protein POM88_013067 [Heracleum sosnowskyi]
MAARFGAKIIPFGVVGEDDVSQLLLDYDDQLKIPFLQSYYKEFNQSFTKLRADSEGEIAKQDLHLPISLPKVPGRFYFLFGKPIETEAKEFHLDILQHEINTLAKDVSQDYQEIAFCHNDLQYGNIMIDEKTRSVTVIDYEYASFNPVAYDLVNHFCEMAANYHSEKPHILDYSTYPGLEERKRFVHSYLGSDGNQLDDSEVQRHCRLTPHVWYRLVYWFSVIWYLNICNSILPSVHFSSDKLLADKTRQVHSHHVQILYKPDLKGETKLGKNVVFDMDMSAGDFMALLYLIKLPVEVINLKVGMNTTFLTGIPECIT